MGLGDLLPGGGTARTTGGMFGAGSPTFLTSKIDAIVNWGRLNSLWPMPFATAWLKQSSRRRQTARSRP